MQYYVIGWFEESTQGTATNPHKLTLTRVTARKAEAGSLNDIPIADFDNRGSKYVDVTFTDCDIDFTGTTGYGLHIDEKLKNDNDPSQGRVNNIHLVVENSTIKASGKYDAIRGALSVITYNIDAESILQKNGVDCNTDLTRDQTIAPPPPSGEGTTSSGGNATTPSGGNTTTAPSGGNTTTEPSGGETTEPIDATTPADEDKDAPSDGTTTAAPTADGTEPEGTTEAADAAVGGCAGCGGATEAATDETTATTTVAAIVIAMAAAVAIIIKKK